MQTKLNTKLLIILACVQLVPASLAAAQRNRIVGPVDNQKRVALRGHVHTRASAENDQGRADASLVLPYVTVMLKQTAAQEADLNQLLTGQQDPSSANYHKWLTPEEYADRFGVSQDDVNSVVTWLEQQRLTVVGVARARNWVAFSGTARAVESAFGTEIHNYRVNGEMHFANATEPTIPAAFDGVVGAIHGLTNFRLRPAVRPGKIVPKGDQPNYNSSKGSHFLAPDDVATIYNIQPLYNAGVDGTNQKIVVVGQTQIQIADIQQFRTFFNLPASDPQIILVPNTTQGVSTDDLPEADLDIEWSGAVARNASIIYVYSDDVETSAQYAIDQNLAPVLTMSYGLCEALTPGADARIQQAYARQANAQGMTWITASGDSGGADCVGASTRTSLGLAVDLPAALPEVTGIGGTRLTEGSGAYWNSTNSANHASALSYIPETAWNDSVLDGAPSASGGGASSYYAKPFWQVGVGVPSDGARDVPDVSLAGSADHDSYLIYSSGSLQGVGGTSVGAPSFSGMAALLNHYLVTKGVQASPGLGNMNPRLYAVAQSAPGAFHDITSGDNLVDPCPAKARTCTATNVGFSAGTGYDQVTGLGSVDAFALITSWPASGGGAASRSTANIVLSSDANSITTGDTTIVTATVKGVSGATPTGTVTFTQGSTTLGTATLAGSGGSATATLTLTGAQLAVGTDTITAQYSGDGAFAAGTASTTVTVVTVTSSGTPSITGLANGASFQKVYAPGMIVSVFGSQLSTVTASAPRVPLPVQLGGVSATINGVNAPIYYVSPTQLNLQIPYETPVNGNAVLVISNNGQTTSTSFRVTAAAPGIFVSNGAPVPNTSGARGQVVSLYVTGDGLVTPTLATGASPAAGTAAANLPKPQQAVSITVGGVNAQIQFIGITVGLVGVTQINYTVPAGSAVGAQQVVVTVGGVASAPATLTVTQ